MAIKVRHTDIGDVARLGILAGKSVAAQREIGYARAMSEQLRRMEHEKEMTAFRAQLDIEAEKRSRQWELEKMEIRSRTDFTREEARRQQKLSEKQSRLDALERAYKDGQITEEDYRNAYLQETTDVPFYSYAKQAQMRGAARSPIQEYMTRLMAEEQPTTAPATTGRIRVISPQGQAGTIEAAEWSVYEAQGFRKI